MESQRVFTEQRPPAARVGKRRGTQLPLAIASIVLPGAGHFFLGQPRLGATVLLTVLLAPPAAIALRAVLDEPFSHAGWLIGRLAVLAAVFAVWDTPARAAELAARARERQTGPRLAAWLNAAGYGLGHLRMGERESGQFALLAGGGAHVALVLFAPGPLRWMSELIPLGLAFWGYRTAEMLGTPRRVSIEFDELDSSKPVRTHDPAPASLIPPWWISTTAAVALVWVVGAGFAWITQGLWIAAERVDAREALQMEPYYRNPAYGMSVEMRATGWTFRNAPEGTFVLAQHPAEATQIHLALRPRLPWWDDPLDAAAHELEALAREGFEVTVLEQGATTLAGRPAHRVRGRGIRNGAAREVELRMLALGHRRYVLRAEWDLDHASFARAELRGMLAALQIEGRGETAANTAR